jgi:hypothetical protein
LLPAVPSNAPAAASLDGPWAAPDGSTNYQAALSPGRDPAADAFDAQHVCDPSVVFANGMYYMYYGGLGYSAPYDVTSVGLAASADGYGWQRANGGQPIVQAARPTMPGPFPGGVQYGAGVRSLLK